jgi:hypothetical protein
MLDRILALLDREIASVEHSLMKGACPDYVTYREQVTALAAYEVAKDLARRAFNEEDEE